MTFRGNGDCWFPDPTPLRTGFAWLSHAGGRGFESRRSRLSKSLHLRRFVSLGSRAAGVARAPVVL
jgi:hypothetical protein